MELLQLKYFCKLAESEKLNQTADSLRISPPSLSATIKKLEGEVGVPLFDRIGRSIKLNNAGRIYYGYVSHALSLLNVAEEEIKSLFTRDRSLTIILETQHVYQEFLIDYVNKTPTVKLNIVMFIDWEQMSAAHYDFYLGNLYSIADKDIAYHKLLSGEKYFVVMNKDNPLVKKPELELQELQGETIFELTPSINKSKWEHIKQLFQKSQLAPNLIRGDYLSRYIWVKNGRCIAITTNIGRIFNFPKDDDLVYVPLSTPIQYPRTQVIAWKNGLLFQPCQQYFYDKILEYFSTLSESGKL